MQNSKIEKSNGANIVKKVQDSIKSRIEDIGVGLKYLEREEFFTKFPMFGQFFNNIQYILGGNPKMYEEIAEARIKALQNGISNIGDYKKAKDKQDREDRKNKQKAA